MDFKFCNTCKKLMGTCEHSEYKRVIMSKKELRKTLNQPRSK